MIKIAVFTEGQSDLIFIRQLSCCIIGYDSISFKCFRLFAEETHPIPYGFEAANPLVYLMIVDVGNDTKVLSAIRDREKNLITKGYERIFGLRDMYSQAYRKRSSVIDQDLNATFIAQAQATISQMHYSDRIQLFFAIMELESWLLSSHNLFCKLDPSLSLDKIQTILGFNLKEICPENDLFHPTDQVNTIFNSIGQRYKKSKSQLEAILAGLSESDIHDAIRDNRCPSLESLVIQLELLGTDRV